MSSDEASWTAVLDAMEERLEQAKRLLAGNDFFEVSIPPVASGRMPASVAGQAQRLLDATVLMEKSLSEAMSDLSMVIADVPTWRRTPDRPAPTYIDRSA